MRLWLLLLGALLAGCGGAPVADVPAPSRAEASVFARGFAGPDGLAFDSKGVLYVGNRETNVISRVTPEGAVSDWVKVEGDEALCMEMDGADNLYVATLDRVVKVTPDGTASLFAEGFEGADDLRFDPQGNLYVTDAFVGKVWRIAPDGSKTLFLDLQKRQRPYTWYLTGLEFAPGFEALYLTNFEEGQVLQVPIQADGTAGSPTVIAEGLRSPDHLAVDKAGNLYVTTFHGKELIRLSPDGRLDVLARGPDAFQTPTGIRLAGGLLYIADYNGHTVVQVKLP